MRTAPYIPPPSPVHRSKTVLDWLFLAGEFFVHPLDLCSLRCITIPPALWMATMTHCRAYPSHLKTRDKGKATKKAERGAWDLEGCRRCFHESACRVDRARPFAHFVWSGPWLKLGLVAHRIKDEPQADQHGSAKTRFKRAQRGTAENCSRSKRSPTEATEQFRRFVIRQPPAEPEKEDVRTERCDEFNSQWDTN